ncbi:hypothetical protein M422DRAFT_269862 [Sphaerobolus stellatus SS14]|uniref:Uncharacterized protein n=1 Tax=Sphaerobolus stellatus (strain SS14) TaxID=990650 RepID=A0A0C9UU21_SPHS4|nr:hypothetical protein M422DRAFT_269862 [Sphaerobolus stellatus SS14]
MDGQVQSTVPSSYIEIIHHPHSGKRGSTIISLENTEQETPHQSLPSCLPPSVSSKPWAPFRTRADFEFVEEMVHEAVRAETVTKLLSGFNGRWAPETYITIQNYADFQDSLAAARHFGVQFEEEEIMHTFRGREYRFKFRYRDPWKWILDILTNPMLSELIMWYPVEKYLHQGSRITRLYDELNSGTRWWEIQDSLPHEFGMPHIYLPLHLWLDKSNVAKTVSKHPIILRPGFLSSSIRNGSGNGGGVLIGYMVIVGDPNNNTESEDDSLDSVEYAQFKREIYHKVSKRIFRTLRKKSHNGEAVTCGDKITRVVYPGFLIDAVDGEEGYCVCGTRGVKANHPCARCLVFKGDLHRLSKCFTPRTQEVMVSVYNQALEVSTSTAQQTILKNHGLHLVENAFWAIANSDPYLAYSYDMLHAFDSGEWGKHQWPLFRDNLTQSQKTQLTRNMKQVPRWRGLKHFQARYSEGAVGFDILPRNSAVIQAIRFCGIIRAIASLNPISEEHIEYLEMCLPKYEKVCSHLSADLDKNYNYPKHHNLLHLPEDLRAKGSTVNYTTRPGEGFQQEVKQAYDQTNFKNTEPQMTRIDENQEAIARIRTAVDIHDKLMDIALQEENITDGDECPKPIISQNHWSLGSPLRTISAKQYELRQVGRPGFRHFEKKLRSFLSDNIDAQERPLEPLEITAYQCLYLRYRSIEDWQEKQDVLRCNQDFHGQPRYDCILINTNPVTFGRIIALFSCHGPGKIRHDIAFIRILRPSSRKPKTKWEGCKVFEEKEFDFFLMKYLIRGCHFVPTFDGSDKRYYLNDLVDGDAFLRFFLEERLSQSRI